MASGSVLLFLFVLVYGASYLVFIAHVLRQIQDRRLGCFWYAFALVHPLWALALMPARERY